MHRFRIVAAWLLLSSAVPPAATAQDLAVKAEGLLLHARDQGLSYFNSKDEKAKKSAKKELEEVEQLLKDGVKREPERERYWELLAAAYFYQAYFVFAKNYDDCIETAQAGLKRFPANSKLSYYQGYAHYNSKEYPEALKSFNRYLMAPSGDSARDAQVRQLQQGSQEQFLGNWNQQASFYQSRESRIEKLDPQTYKQVTVFQATRDWELELGSQGFTALTANAPKLEDQELQTYLEGVVERLLSKNPGSPFEFKLTVINSPLVNAVTPPGHIIVFSGLLGFAENESELAGVLAHELAHNYAHHQARAGIKAILLQGSAAALTQLINPKSNAAKIGLAVGTGLGVTLFMRAYSRFEEKEADLYASHMMFNAGYNPTAASGFFLKMYKANPKQPIKFLSTHPPVPDRATYLTDYLESFPLDRELSIDSPAFQKLKKRFASAATGRGALPVP